MIESGHAWMGAATGTSVADSYQYQLQSMWQKCWNTNQQNLVQQLRFRERGPLKSWRPEAMAEAIFSVLKEGLSLSQAARKYDIPYPTFVLYANRVHNMLGPSLDGGTDPRPKARGRPQRILLGMWPEELIRSVIKAVVFRDYREIKEDMGITFAINGQPHLQSVYTSNGNGTAVANGYHNTSKLVGQNTSSVPPVDSPNPLSTMTETLRRHIISQQQQQPIAHTINMYKSPAYLQRSEIEDQVPAAAILVTKQQTSRRSSENLSDLGSLRGFMNIPGLNVIPSQSQHGNAGNRSSAIHSNAPIYKRERELKDTLHAPQHSNYSCSLNANNTTQKESYNINNLPIAHCKSSSQQSKEQANYAYNKRFFEGLPPGMDFEAIANSLLQKSENKSSKFEDFFNAGHDMNEIFTNVEANAAAASVMGGVTYPPVRDSQIMKIKLEHQTADVPHED